MDLTILSLWIPLQRAHHMEKIVISYIPRVSLATNDALPLQQTLSQSQSSIIVISIFCLPFFSFISFFYSLFLPSFSFFSSSFIYLFLPLPRLFFYFFLFFSFIHFFLLLSFFPFFFLEFVYSFPCLLFSSFPFFLLLFLISFLSFCKRFSYTMFQLIKEYQTIPLILSPRTKNGSVDSVSSNFFKPNWYFSLRGS